MPHIQRLWVPHNVSGYRGWRLDGKPEWDTSIYLEGEGASEAPLKTDKLRPHCKPLIDDVDNLISNWLKENYPDCDYEGTYSRKEVFITKYVNEEGVRKHQDDTFLSVLVGLNDAFEGGELELWDPEDGSHEVFRYETGDAVILTGDVEHKGSALKSGERFMLAIFYQQ